MEIVAVVAKWSFIAVSVILVLIAAIFSAIVGIAAIRAEVEILIRKIERRRTTPLVKLPVIPRSPVGPAARKR